MAPTRNAAVVLADYPTTIPEVNTHIKYVSDRTIDLENVDLQGGILTKNLVISVDPYMRGRMRKPEVKSYVVGYEIGKPVTNYVVGKIIRSDDPKYKVGQLTYRDSACEQYTVHPKEVLAKIRILGDEQLKFKLPLTNWVGAAGMPGQTAYYGLEAIGKPKKGDVIFITAASGAVGQLVGQFAKKQGLFVIGSAGSDEKVKFIKDELKFDHAFNYKTTDTATELAKFPPLNIYWDNVGGEQLNAAIGACADKARIVACGMISVWQGDLKPMPNLRLIVGKRIKMEGFIILDMYSDEKWMTEFYATVPKWISEGSITIKEDITKGLENGPQAIVSIFKGDNFGKTVIQIADE